MSTYDLVIDADDAEEMMTRALAWADDSRLDPFTRETFGEIMQDGAGQRFSTESFQGQPWAPLKTATLVRRVAMGYGTGPINVRTGKMKNFLIHSRPTGGPTSDGVEYSWPERVGGELYMKMLRAQGWTRVTARPVIDADESDVDEYIRLAYADLEGFVR